jgi:hypothetical protein
MTAYVESADQDIQDGDQLTFLRRIIPDVEFFGCPNPNLKYIVKQRDYPQEIVIERVNRTVTTVPEQIHTRIRARQIVQRFQSDGVGTAWRLGATRVDVQPNGRR